MAILNHSPEARLIVIDNGSNRETELMLEEFSESLGDRHLFITPPRNIGLVPALNRGLSCSDADIAIIVRPHVLVCSGWLEALLDAAAVSGSGIVSPVFHGPGAPPLPRPSGGCGCMETFSVSFAALLLQGALHRTAGGFDEGLDGGEWCLRDYIRRAGSAGYRTSVIARPELFCGPETVFGSQERRQELTRVSKARYNTRWGASRHYCLYFGKEPEADSLADSLEVVIAAARRGHRLTLYLHGKQYRQFRKKGWNSLHTGVELRALSLLTPGRDLARQYARLQAESPELIPVCASDAAQFPGIESAISFRDIALSLGISSTPDPIH